VLTEAVVVGKKGSVTGLGPLFFVQAAISNIITNSNK